MLICKFLLKTKRNIVNPSHWITWSSLFLWTLVFFTQAHKEERFLFPVYPLIGLVAAFSLEMVQKAANHLLPKLAHLYASFVLLFVVIFGALSISRSLALYRGYNAPLNTYMELGRLNNELNVTSTVNVCVGKEWHRFPNSFFLPTDRWQLRFVKSEFQGQLPKPFSSDTGTRGIPTNMNNENREEHSRYVNVNTCHFIVDSDYPTFSKHDVPYSKQKENWTPVASFPFLDARRSPTLLRAFYVPFLTERRCSYVSYNLLRNKRLSIE